MFIQVLIKNLMCDPSESEITIKSWHESLEINESKKLRGQTIQSISAMILERRTHPSSSWKTTLGKLSSHIEKRLYYLSDSLVEYMDPLTLFARIQVNLRLIFLYKMRIC